MMQAPSGFDTQVEVAVMSPKKPQEEVSAFVLAFGSRGHRCLAFFYATTASGSDGEQLVGDRLATMVERSLARLDVASSLVPPVVRAKAQGLHP